MSTTDVIEKTRTGEGGAYANAKTPPADPNPAVHPLATPVLALAVFGYHLAVTVLRLVNRDRSAQHPGPV